MEQGNAIIRLHYKKDPDELNDEEWAGLIQEWTYIRTIELKNLKAAIKEAIIEAHSKNEE